MAQVYKNGRILQKVDTEENWFANDPEILKGEICVSTFDDGKVKIKIAGEHGKKWSQIDYLETDSSLVHYDTYDELPEAANNGSIAIIDSETKIDTGEIVYTKIKKGTFRSATSAEFVYMLDTRDGAHDRRFRATLTDAIEGGLKGLIILPDAYDLSKLPEYASDDYGKLLTKEEFIELENKGSYFLGNGGNFFISNSYEITEVRDFNTKGWYWSSSFYGGYARSIANTPGDGIIGDDYWFETRPLGVRLVVDCSKDDLGAISVGEGKYIKFTKGNLQYEIGDGTWYLAGKQWEVLGPDQMAAVTSGEGKIDLLYFGSSGFENRIPTHPADRPDRTVQFDIAGTNYDWGLYCDILSPEHDLKVYKPGSAFIYNADLEKWEGISSYETLEETLIPERVDALENEKVDKVEGKGLSTNDFSDEYKAKVDNIANPIQLKGRVDTVEDLPTTGVKIGWAYLVGAEGSENFEEYVCTALSGTPEIPTWESLGKVSEQADWDENDENSPAYVNNRTHWTEESELTLVELENVQGNYTFFDFAEPIVAGETYTMIASGFSPDALNTTETVIAESPLDSTDVQIYNSNGLSFIQRENPPSQAEGKHGQFNGPTGGNVILKKNVEIVHQLDPKYVPDDVQKVSTGEYVYIDYINGDDNNIGSYDKPVKTLEHAVDLSNIGEKKYVKFKGSRDVYIKNMNASNDPLRYPVGKDMRIWTLEDQTFYFNEYYPVWAEFKIRGNGNVYSTSPISPCGLDYVDSSNYTYTTITIDIDVTGDVTMFYPQGNNTTYNGHTHYSYENDKIKVKCKTFNVAFNSSAISNPLSTTKYFAWPIELEVNSESVYVKPFSLYAQYSKLTIVTKYFELTESSYTGTINFDVADIKIDKLVLKEQTGWSSSSFKIFGNNTHLKNARYWLENDIDLPSSSIFINNVVFRQIQTSLSNNGAIIQCETADNYNDDSDSHFLRQKLNVIVNTCDISKISYPNYGLISLQYSGNDLSGHCGHVYHGNSQYNRGMYPWDFLWNVKQLYVTGSYPQSGTDDKNVSNNDFIWLDDPKSVLDFYLCPGSSGHGDGRTKDHPCSDIHDLVLSTQKYHPSGIRLHVMPNKSNIYSQSSQSYTIYYTDNANTQQTATVFGVNLNFGELTYSGYGYGIMEIIPESEYMDLYVSYAYSGMLMLRGGFNNVTITGYCNELFVDGVTQFNLTGGYSVNYLDVKCKKINCFDWAVSGMASIECDNVQNSMRISSFSSNITTLNIRNHAQNFVNSMGDGFFYMKVGGFLNYYDRSSIGYTVIDHAGQDYSAMHYYFASDHGVNNSSMQLTIKSNDLNINSYQSEQHTVSSSKIVINATTISINGGLTFKYGQLNITARDRVSLYCNLQGSVDTIIKSNVVNLYNSCSYTTQTQNLLRDIYPILKINANLAIFYSQTNYNYLQLKCSEVNLNANTIYTYNSDINIGRLKVKSGNYISTMNFNVDSIYCKEHEITTEDMELNRINVDTVELTKRSNSSSTSVNYPFYCNMMCSYTDDTTGDTVYVGTRLDLNVKNFHSEEDATLVKLFNVAPGAQLFGSCLNTRFPGDSYPGDIDPTWPPQTLNRFNYMNSLTSDDIAEVIAIFS